MTTVRRCVHQSPGHRWLHLSTYLTQIRAVTRRSRLWTWNRRRLCIFWIPIRQFDPIHPGVPLITRRNKILNSALCQERNGFGLLCAFERKNWSSQTHFARRSICWVRGIGLEFMLSSRTHNFCVSDALHFKTHLINAGLAFVLCIIQREKPSFQSQWVRGIKLEIILLSRSYIFWVCIPYIELKFNPLH